MKFNPLLASTTFRLATLYLTLFTGALLLVLGFIYWSSVVYMRQQTDAAINTEISGFAERYNAAGPAGVKRLIENRLSKTRLNTDSVYLLTDVNRTPITGNLNRWPKATITEEPGWIDLTVEHVRDGPRPIRARTILLRGQFGLFGLLVGRDINALTTIEKRLRRAMLLAAAISTILGILSAVFMTRSVMRRIDIINATSQSIVRSGDLSRRIPESGNADEFDALASNLNHMLARIEDLLMGIRRVSDSVAHDLRTPLARLRNRLEIMVHDAEREAGQGHEQTAESEVKRSMLESALADTDHLLDTFNALLRIARIETGNTRNNMTQVNLNALLADVVELYEPTADEADILLRQQDGNDVTVVGDRDLLFQATANLVDNAIKFSDPNSEISVSSYMGSDGPALAVKDYGPGIPEHLRADVFQRFYRADKSRSSAGNGLGLSLVQAVAQLHNAQIDLSVSKNDIDANEISEKPGLTVTITFPQPDARMSTG